MAASLRKALISWQWQNCLRSRQVAKKFVQNQISAFSSYSSLHVEVQLQGVPQNLVEVKGETQTLLDIALQHKDYFGLKHLVTLRDLFNARVHYGHNAGLRHESMTPYIYGCRQGIDIIDLEQTLSLLEQALNVCAHIVYRGGMVLFVCRNLQFLPWVEKTVRELGEYAHCRPWKRGIFTNAANIFNTLPIYPELCIFLGTQDTVFETHRAVVESNKLLIPSIGILDTNTDCASLITYPIPGNDDSPESLALYLHLFKTAILKAKEKRKQDGIVS
ncbi:28S ribosomal protein S2 mitochondrial [Biomphalaria pfeifferi]|uniref:28S ribosomal protein S2 mitochondrial n=1 Tax=Biomphalaria pfeifferi TaxID=112525 RepID=A0AAD8BZZ8_BIOPF|nr:28S ribosomal protein S2 mitochondrial [Biomphalaria pfeifferi]